MGDALDSLHIICDGAQEMLRPGGFIALETGGTITLGSILS
jgi:hypothetical protein